MCSGHQEQGAYGQTKHAEANGYAPSDAPLDFRGPTCVYAAIYRVKGSFSRRLLFLKDRLDFLFVHVRRLRLRKGVVHGHEAFKGF